MLKIDSDYNIIYTQGDTFVVQYDLGEHCLKNGETAIFSVSLDGEVVLDATIEGNGQSVLTFAIENMTLPVGRYKYDMHINQLGYGKFTTDFPKQLIILPTAH